MTKVAKGLIVFLIVLLAVMAGILVYLQTQADSAQDELRARNTELTGQLQESISQKSELGQAWNRQRAQYERALVAGENLVNETDLYLGTLDEVVDIQASGVTVREGVDTRRLISSREILDLESTELREEIAEARAQATQAGVEVQELAEE